VGGVLWALTPLREPLLGGRFPGELAFRPYNLVLVCASRCCWLEPDGSSAGPRRYGARRVAIAEGSARSYRDLVQSGLKDMILVEDGRLLGPSDSLRAAGVLEKFNTGSAEGKKIVLAVDAPGPFGQTVSREAVCVPLTRLMNVVTSRPSASSRLAEKLRRVLLPQATQHLELALQVLRPMVRPLRVALAVLRRGH
jgi:hypothetical protein